MRKLLMKKLRNQKGLTLIELLAVVVILGIIAAIAVPSIGNIIENSKRDAAIANAQMVQNAVRLYVAAGGPMEDTNGTLSSNKLSSAYTGTGGVNEYVEDLTNPWGGAAPSWRVTSPVGSPPEVTVNYVGGTAVAGPPGIILTNN